MEYIDRQIGAVNTETAPSAAIKIASKKIKGLLPPITPPDRTHIYHKYRVRLDPKALGINIEPKSFRDKVMNALIAEGVDIVL